MYFLENEFKAPHGVIDLSQCVTVKSIDDKMNRKFCFEIKTKTEAFILCAESKKVKDEWIGRLGRAIVVNSSSYKSSPLVKH